VAKGLGDQIGSGLSQGLTQSLSHGREAVGTLGDYLRQQRQASRLSLRQLAEAAGVSNPYLSQIERGLRRPSAEVLQSIAKALRISAETLYVQAGILSLSEVEVRSVERAVRADGGLTERQKDALVDIYRSLRAANGVPLGEEPATPSAGLSEPPGSPEPAEPTHPAAPTYDSEHDNSVEGH
jgi:transcriptional regulator with XRE-family HTH domain